MTKSPKDYMSEARTKEIVRLRQLNWSYRKIGDRYGISRERVRQLFLAAGQDWATGWHWNEIPLATCPECGGEFKPEVRNVRYCSRYCWFTHLSNTLTPRQRECREIVMRSRRAGETWQQTVEACGWTVNEKGTSLPSHFRRWCAKDGTDPSPYMGNVEANRP